MVVEGSCKFIALEGGGFVVLLLLPSFARTGGSMVSMGGGMVGSKVAVEEACKFVAPKDGWFVLLLSTVTTTVTKTKNEENTAKLPSNKQQISCVADWEASLILSL